MISFRENQKFNQWWVWLVLIVLTCLIFFKVYKNIISHDIAGLKHLSDTRIIIYALLPIILITLFSIISLETEVDELGISYQFFPFNLKKIIIPWSAVEKAYIRKYNPITEYGGYGYRLGIFGHGRALNISGNMGLQLILKNGKKILLGTKKDIELNKILDDLKDKKFLVNKES